MIKRIICTSSSQLRREVELNVCKSQGRDEFLLECFAEAVKLPGDIVAAAVEAREDNGVSIAYGVAKDIAAHRSAFNDKLRAILLQADRIVCNVKIAARAPETVLNASVFIYGKLWKEPKTLKAQIKSGHLPYIFETNLK